MGDSKATKQKPPAQLLRDFLSELAKNRNLALDEVPPILQDIVKSYAQKTSQPDYASAPFCRRVTSQALEELCFQCFEELDRQSLDKEAIASACTGLALIRAWRLAPGLGLLYVPTTIESTITNLWDPESLRSSCPQSVSDKLLKLIEGRLKSFAGKEGQISGTAKRYIEQGYKVLSDVVLNRYTAVPHATPLYGADQEQSEENHRPSHLVQSLLPAPPAYYVPTETVEWVTQALLAAEPGDGPCYQVIVLHGKKGVGKTTAAKAILHHEPLRRFFQDGILYIPLEGEEDRQLALWRACRQAGLAVERAARPDELRDAFWQWARQENRLALLVLDEPQRAEDLLPLLNVGPQVRLLITCQDRHSVARAIEEYWAPASDLVFWQAVGGLTPQEGLRLVQHWQPDNLSPDEEETRRHVGELLHWHPSALRSSVIHAQATSWHAWEAEVIEGDLEPDDLQELAAEAETMWARLSLRDQQALSELRRAFHETSSFGPGIAATVWNEKVEQAAKCMSRLEGAGVIEKIAQEPWPWQGLIQAAYGGQDRYRLSPLVRLIRREAEQPRWYDRSGWQGLMWRLRIASRSRGLMAHLQAAESRYWLRELALALDLIRHGSKWDRPDLEKRLRDLWEVRGLFPPAEVWIDFKGLQWFHGSPQIFLAMFGTVAVVAGILWAVAVKASTWAPLIFWPAVALIAFCVLPLSIVIARQRAYWTLLLGLYDPEMPEAAFVRACRKERGLPDLFSEE